MDKLLQTMLSIIFQNNGSGTPSKQFSLADFWDAVQVAGYGALVAGVTASQTHLEGQAESETGMAALAAGALVFVVKLLFNYLANNGETK